MLRAGVAKADITPPVGVDLCGYAGRPGPSVGIHDRLEAQALVLEAGGRRAAIVAADIIGFDGKLVESTKRQVAERLARRVSLEPGGLLLAAAHTHSGPSLRCLRGMGEPNAAYLEKLARILADTVARAASNLEEALIGAGKTEARISINRRQRTDQGTVLGKDAQKPTDPELALLRIDRAGGGPLAILMNYACHAVVLGGDNLLLSADYPGYARRLLEQRFPDAVVMFTNGACGDINPAKMGSFELAREQGESLGEAAYGLAREIATRPAGRVEAREAELALPTAPLPDEKKAAEELERLQAELDTLERESAAPGRIRTARAFRDWARDVLGAVRQGKQQEPVRSVVSALSVDDIALVGIPAELLVEIGMEIKRRSPFKTTFVIGYANKVVGYIPTRKAFEEGGYEVDTACKFYGLTPFLPEVHEITERTALDLLASLREE
jgi:hypothetical protein